MSYIDNIPILQEKRLMKMLLNKPLLYSKRTWNPELVSFLDKLDPYYDNFCRFAYRVARYDDFKEDNVSWIHFPFIYHLLCDYIIDENILVMIVLCMTDRDRFCISYLIVYLCSKGNFLIPRNLIKAVNQI